MTGVKGKKMQVNVQIEKVNNKWNARVEIPEENRAYRITRDTYPALAQAIHESLRELYPGSTFRLNTLDMLTAGYEMAAGEMRMMIVREFS